MNDEDFVKNIDFRDDWRTLERRSSIFRQSKGSTFINKKMFQLALRKGPKPFAR